MMPGVSPITAAPGNDEDKMLVFDVADAGDGLGCRVKLRARDGYGDRYWAIVLDHAVKALFWLPEGATRILYLAYNPDYDGEHAVSAVDHGLYPAVHSDLAVAQRRFYADKSKFVQLEWDAVVEQIGAAGDGGQLSNWNLTGLRRWLSGLPAESSTTELEIQLVLTTDGGDHALQLVVGGRTVSSGTRTGNGSITLAEGNGSDVSGTVVLAYSADLALEDGAVFRARWARGYEVHYDSPSLSFPRAYDKLVIDPGRANRISTIVGPLAAGSYEWLTRAITNTEATGSNTTPGTFTVPGAPEPPGAISLQSPPGDYAGTKVQFAASATAGATYRIYDSALGEPPDMEAVADTHIAGSGTLLHTLPAIASGTGKRRVVAVALFGGIEDPVRREIVIEYLSGAVVLPRPNIPDFKLISRDGLAPTFDYVYDAGEEAGDAATLKLYLCADGGTPNYNSPHGSVSLGTGRVQKGTITNNITALVSAGFYRGIVRAMTAGGVLSENTALSPRFYLSEDEPDAPGNFRAELVG